MTVRTTGTEIAATEYEARSADGLLLATVTRTEARPFGGGWVLRVLPEDDALRTAILATEYGASSEPNWTLKAENADAAKRALSVAAQMVECAMGDLMGLRRYMLDGIERARDVSANQPELPLGEREG